VHQFILDVVADHPRKKLCGICWGHQTISMLFGAELVDMETPEVREPESDFWGQWLTTAAGRHGSKAHPGRPPFLRGPGERGRSAPAAPPPGSRHAPERVHRAACRQPVVPEPQQRNPDVPGAPRKGCPVCHAADPGRYPVVWRWRGRQGRAGADQKGHGAAARRRRGLGEGI
jgi:hypothetical protein